MWAGELTLPPAGGSVRWPSLGSAGELTLVLWTRESHQPSCQLCPGPGQDTWKGQPCFSKAVGPCVTQGNNRITLMTPCKAAVLIVSKKSEILNQANDSLQMKMCGQKDTLWDTPWHTTDSMMRSFLWFVCYCHLFICLCIFLFLRGFARTKDRYEGRGTWAVSLEWWCETHKDSVKSFYNRNTLVFEI